MINARHEALNRYTLMMGFIGLLLVPLLVVLFSERHFPRERGETANVPRYLNHADYFSYSFYDEESMIVVSLPTEGETYLGKFRTTPEELIEGIRKLARVLPANKRIVYLKGGAGLSYEGIIEVLKTIRTAGVDRVGLVVKKEKGPDGRDRGGCLEVRLQPETDRGTNQQR